MGHIQQDERRKHVKVEKVGSKVAIYNENMKFVLNTMLQGILHLDES